MSMRIGITVLYFLLLFGLGLWASRRVRNMKDYYVAGKGLGYWLVSFSSRATGESGWLLLGLTGFGFAFGMHGFWVVLGEMMGVTLCWVFLTQRFKVLTDHYDCITVTDYLSDRLGDSKHVIRLLATLALVVFITAYVAAQFTACGKAFSGFFEIEHIYGVLIGVVIVGFYTIAGGFLAVVWSDLIQGLLMLLGLVAIPVVALITIGGPAEMISALGQSHTDGLTNGASLLDPWMGDSSAVGIMGVVSLVAIGLGFLGSPQLFVRFISVKNVEELGKGSLVATLFTLITDAGAVLTGMCGRVLVEQNGAMGTLKEMAGTNEIASAKEQILPYLSNLLFPEILTGVLVAIVLAAIMSTADSLLILVSSAVVRDVWQRTLGVQMSDTQARNRARLVTASVCGLAFALALDPDGVVFSLVLFAWTGITATFCPVLILSLFWSGLTRAGAVVGMCWGMTMSIIWTVPVNDIPWVKTYLWSGFSGSAEEAMIPAFFGALILTRIVSLLTTPPPEARAVLAQAESQVVDIWR